ncbi:hypothetical protein [Hydrogenophaga sp. ZJX-1]|uniref:hypothetical protein n=1 Tax=Hydrogenophaga sp. ZJX-1 TaxID=3404778 RepID=UPI003B27F0A4
MLKLLLRPFSYLSIKHEDPIFTWINWYIPGFFAVLSGFIWCIPIAVVYFGLPTPHDADVWGINGLVGKIQGLIQNLPGFYTAALAIVATFGGRDMLKAMPGKPPKMKFLVEGVLTKELELSRRLFLSSMFAYLTALSFLLTLFSAIAVTLAPVVKSMTPPFFVSFLDLIFIGFYVLFLSQMLTVTGWGLYYLGEKIHLSGGPDV